MKFKFRILSDWMDWKKVSVSTNDKISDFEREIDIEDKIVERVMEYMKFHLAEHLGAAAIKNDDFMQKLLDACLEDAILKGVVTKAIQETAKQHIKTMLGDRPRSF